MARCTGAAMETPLALVRPVLVAMLAVVASFVAALWISQLGLATIEDDVYAIAANAEPSVGFLDAARAELESAGIYADEYVEAIASGLSTAPATREEALASRRQADRSLAAYAQLPFFPGEEARYAELQDALRPVDLALGVVLDRAASGDVEGARRELSRELHDGIRRAEDLMSRMVEYDEQQAQHRLSAIRTSRRRSTLTAVGLGGFSFALSVIASVVALRGLTRESARREQLEHERARCAAAEEEVRTRDDFLRLASHELRTPVTALQLSLQALRRGAAATMLGTAEAQTRRMSDLVEELVDVAEIHLGRVLLSPSEVDLAALVREVVASRRADAERVRCAVTVGGDAPVTGWWDRAHLAHVVLNLLSNALRFGAGAPVEITVSRAGGAARLVVRDHGVGVPRGRLPFVFELFERAAPAGRSGGLGLGLYVARALVAAHGGWIRCESEEGVGSTFTVELPLASGAPLPSGLPSPA